MSLRLKKKRYCLPLFFSCRHYVCEWLTICILRMLTIDLSMCANVDIENIIFGSFRFVFSQFFGSASMSIPEKRPCEHHRDKNSFYCNKVILGPMVRAGTLPLRLLSLRHGANIVFTEEIIDFKLINSKRVVNTILNTIDFIDDTGFVVFRTCQEEKDKVILQVRFF